MGNLDARSVPAPDESFSFTAWQYYLPLPLQLQQKIPAGHILHPANWRVPVPEPAEFPGQPVAAPRRVAGNQLPDCLDVIFVYLCYPEFRFCFHALILHDYQFRVQHFLSIVAGKENKFGVAE